MGIPSGPVLFDGFSCLICFNMSDSVIGPVNIAARTTPHYPGATWCNLCLAEKRFILRADPTTMLNKRSELNGKCRHKNKFKLKNFS